jgi:F-type H+-transporting ATPase subunit epsilon
MSIKVDIITPERLVYSDAVDHVVVPAADGEVGIFKDHTPLLTKLGAGDLRLVKGNNTDHIALTGGFLEVEDGNRVSIFAETADMAGEIDEEKTRLEAERLKQELSGTKKEEFDWDQAELALKSAIAKLKVAQYKKSSPKQHS